MNDFSIFNTLLLKSTYQFISPTNSNSSPFNTCHFIIFIITTLTIHHSSLFCFKLRTHLLHRWERSQLVRGWQLTLIRDRGPALVRQARTLRNHW